MVYRGLWIKLRDLDWAMVSGIGFVDLELGFAIVSLNSGLGLGIGYGFGNGNGSEDWNLGLCIRIEHLG